MIGMSSPYDTATKSILFISFKPFSGECGGGCAMVMNKVVPNALYNDSVLTVIDLMSFA